MARYLVASGIRNDEISSCTQHSSTIPPFCETCPSRVLSLNSNEAFMVCNKVKDCFGAILVVINLRNDPSYTGRTQTRPRSIYRGAKMWFRAEREGTVNTLKGHVLRKFIIFND
ncbi:hypothetical protein J6590_064600 [Homalodisca vitripennis]|nr:hypothetical protein J6590_064600 [Homalodisca vitripennis]